MAPTRVPSPASRGLFLSQALSARIPSSAALAICNDLIASSLEMRPTVLSPE
jgi:hypothetical protein